MPSRLADVFKGQPDPIHPPNTKLLDFNSLQQVPDSYKWTQFEDRDTLHSPVATESVPLIDLSDPNALNTIAQVCKTWGVFQVINHGVPLTLLDDIEFVSNTLFSLPAHQKLKAERPPQGICGYGTAKISHFFSKFMWFEGFTIVGSPLEHFRLLWPQDYAQFCNIIEEYQKEMQKLAAKLMWLMLSPLGITIEDLIWADGPNGDCKGSSAALQLNYYPACPDPDKAMGLAAHTDSTLVTILQQNITSGLQVFKEGTGWVTVPPVPGALIINIGDLLHILSNGLYSSVRHRALVNRSKTRLSMAYLYGPPSNVAISPLQKLVGPNQPAMYRPVTWPEYLSTKAKLFNEALSSVRI